MGDFNAKVDKETANSACGKFGLGSQNKRGEDLIDFCISNNLVISNNFFKHHPRHLYTWKSPDRNTRNQIDYIIINQKWKSYKNARTRPGADCNNDHQLLEVIMKVQLKKMSQPVQLRLDYKSVPEDCQNLVSNSFAALLRCEEEKTPNEFWSKGKEIILDAAKKTIPQKEEKEIFLDI